MEQEQTKDVAAHPSEVLNKHTKSIPEPQKMLETLTAKVDELTRLVIEGGKKTLTIEECAKLLQISTAGVYKMTATREIPFYKPTGKRIFFKRDELEAWIFRHRNASNEEIEAKAATYCATNKR